MKAVAWHDVGDIRLDDVPDPRIRDPYDAIVEITTSAICGTDLHFVRGTMPGMNEGTILGHEAVGVVQELGSKVSNFQVGDRVVVASTIACGWCSYCRAGYFAQCDNANPGGSLAGTAFFGGPAATGSFDGLQAEYARVPYANVGLVPLPDQVSDEQAIILSDIMPTGWFGCRVAGVSDGDVVVVMGAGPVGQCAALSARAQGAGRVIVVDGIPDRLDLARALHAETVDFNAGDPVAAVRDVTGGVGPDRVVDAVGVESEAPRAEHESIGTFTPGDAPGQASAWAVEMVAKAGSIGIIGVYPPTVETYSIGQAMNKNLTLRMGNCNHRRYIPELVGLVTAGVLDTSPMVTKWSGVQDVIEAYGSFDRRETGWSKVALPMKDR